MKHLFIKGKNHSEETLILLHGTGGRETDLLDIAATVNSSANILAFRGDVLEGHQLRFFKRIHPKKYDEDSLKNEGQKLYDEIQKIFEMYELDLNKAFIIGYSNGANIGAHVLLNYPLTVFGAFLMHPAYYTEQMKDLDLSHLNVLITAGARDFKTPAGDAFKVKQLFEARNANVQVELTDGGHEIHSDEPMQGHVFYIQKRSAL